MNLVRREWNDRFRISASFTMFAFSSHGCTTGAESARLAESILIDRYSWIADDVSECEF